MCRPRWTPLAIGLLVHLWSSGAWPAVPSRGATSTHTARLLSSRSAAPCDDDAANNSWVDNSVPRLHYEDDHVAVVHKPVGFALFDTRASLARWALAHVSRSSAPDALAAFAPVSTLGPDVAGLVPLAKTAAAEARRAACVEDSGARVRHSRTHTHSQLCGREAHRD